MIFFFYFREHIAVSILNSEVSELSSSQLSQDSYLVEVEEGHLYQEILRLDVTYSNNQVATTCSFQLLTEQVPFIIEGQGKEVAQRVSRICWDPTDTDHFYHLKKCSLIY